MISDTDSGESFAESEVPGTGTEAFSGVCASKVLLNCSLGAVSGIIPDVRATIESLSFFSIISPMFWVKYSRRGENAGCGSESLDSGIEDPRVEVLEIVVEGGSLFSSTKGSFNFNPEARSSEVGEDDILLATWRELKDEEKKVMVGGDSFFLRGSQKTETKIWLFPKKREQFTVIKLGDNQWDPSY